MKTSEILGNKFVIALNTEIANAIIEQMDRDKVNLGTNFIYDDENVFIDTITVGEKEYCLGLNLDIETWIENIQDDDFDTKFWYGGFNIQEGYENDFKVINEIIKNQTGKTIDELLKMKEVQASIINDFDEEIYEVLGDALESDEVCFDDENGWKF